MSGRTWAVVSFGKRYLLASLIYIGLALGLVCSLPTSMMPVSTASGTECDAENPCTEGYYCCDGYCIPDDFLCCDDGTYGPDYMCCCCGDEGSTTAACQL